MDATRRQLQRMEGIMQISECHILSPVACQRGKTFDAEIMFSQVTQRKVGSGYTTREDAKAAAMKIIQQIEKQMHDTVMAALNEFPEAKA